jgi:hypothetical protein
MFDQFRRKLLFGAATALLVTGAGSGAVLAANAVNSADFEMRVSSTASACLPHAHANVHIKSRGPVEVMTVDATGLPPGCPGTVTPFNGEHNAGIQVLNTAQYPDAQGPLRQIHN